MDHRDDYQPHKRGDALPPITGTGDLRAGVTIVQAAAPKRRARKPRLNTLIKQAEKAGKSVTSVTKEGVTLTFGAADKSVEPDDPWERAMQGPKQ